MSENSTKKKQRNGVGRGNNPKSRANLRPSTPGMTNNPNGKPKGTLDRATVFKKWLAVKTKIADPANPENEIEITFRDAIALGMIEAATQGNANAYKVIEEAEFGKLTEKTELTGKDGGAIGIEIENVAKLSDEELRKIVKS